MILKIKQVRHWLVVNIPEGDVNSGQTIMDFYGSAPSIDTGLHRYVFLLFKQLDGETNFDMSYVNARSQDNRLGTSTRALMKTYNLKPVAGNFYTAEYDDYVPALRRKIMSPRGSVDLTESEILSNIEEK